MKQGIKIFCCTTVVCAMLFSARTFADRYVVVHGSTLTLDLYDDQDGLLKTYPVGLGKQGMGKTQKGDERTPVGEYHVLWKASRFWEVDGGYPIEEGKTFFGKNNTIILNSERDDEGKPMWIDFFGGEEAVVMCLDYPNDLDRAQGFTGSGITLQASHLGGIGQWITRGGVRMDPADARDLYRELEVGSKVIFSFE